MGLLESFQALLNKRRRFARNFLRVATIAANGEAFTIGSETFSCVSADPEAFEFIPGADAAGSATNIAACINANTTQKIKARAFTGGVLIQSTKPGNRALACTETLAGTNNAWASATMYGGSAEDAFEKTRGFELIPIVPNATEVAVGRIDLPLNFTPSGFIVDVRVTATGVAKAWDGGITKDGTDPQLVAITNAGSTDWETTDTITVLAFE
jgi:hypothetical protein